MIYINPNRVNIKLALDTHFKKLFKLIKIRVSNCKNKDISMFLNDKNLKVILTGTPSEILTLNNLFYKKIPNYSLNGFENFKINIDVNKKRRSAKQEKNIIKYSALNSGLISIFNYDESFSKKESSYSTYDLAAVLNINTCVYCNRLYTKTVIKPEKTTRPEFDHWFPKSKYPLLALSFYNLIPSCNVCNGSIKGSKEMALNTHLHPYIDKVINFRFSFFNRTYNSYGFKIISLPNSKDSNTVGAFKIEKIYESHLDEIEDLKKIRDAYSESYLLTLQKSFPGLLLSDDEIYRLAFGVHKEEADFEKRPLSKMKKDILIELGIIKP